MERETMRAVMVALLVLSSGAQAATKMLLVGFGYSEASVAEAVRLQVPLLPAASDALQVSCETLPTNDDGTVDVHVTVNDPAVTLLNLVFTEEGYSVVRTSFASSGPLVVDTSRDEEFNFSDAEDDGASGDTSAHALRELRRRFGAAHIPASGVK